MGPQRPELPTLALAPVVHNEFGHDVGQAQLHRAHGPVRHHQSAGLDPFGFQQRCGLAQARGLNHNVGARHGVLPVVTHPHRLTQILGEPLAECVAALGPRRMHADLVEVEQLVEQPHVPVSGATGTNMTQHLAVLAGQVLGANGCHRAGTHVGDGGGIDDGDRDAGAWVKQVKHP